MCRRFVLVILVALVGCSPTSPSVRLDEDFVLAPKDTVRVAEAGFSIRFLGVEGDSRCPADAICIQGGDALVRIEVRSLGSGVQSYALHTGDMRPVVHDGLTIALVELAPYPFSSRTTQPDEYRATLRVSGP
jgi:hypothetical protein